MKLKKRSEYTDLENALFGGENLTPDRAETLLTPYIGATAAYWVAEGLRKIDGGGECLSCGYEYYEGHCAGCYQDDVSHEDHCEDCKHVWEER